MTGSYDHSGMRCHSFLMLFHEWEPFGVQVIVHHFNAGMHIADGEITICRKTTM